MKFRLFLCLLFAFTAISSFAQSGSKEQLAMQYYNSGEFDKATELFEELYQANPNTFFYNYLLQSCLQGKDYKKAEKIVKKAASQGAKSLKYTVDLGYVYENGGEHNKAQKQYEEAVQKLPNSMQIISDVAQQFISHSKFDFAIRTYQKGRELLKEPLGFTNELAQLYERTGNYAEMMNEYIILVENQEDALPTVEIYLQYSLADDPTGKKAEAFKELILKKTQKQPEVRLYSDLLMWYSLQQKDFEMAFIQAKAMDKRFKEEGKTVFEIAQICMQNQSYDVAVQAYKYILSKGKDNIFYTESEIGSLDARFLQLKKDYKLNPKDLETLNQDYIKTLNELGQTPQTVVLMNNFAHLKAFYLHDMPGAIKVLEDAVEVPGLSKNILADCKLELGDILLLDGKPWDASLQYSQVEKSLKNDAEGAMAKFKNAKLSYYIGEFEWASSQLNVLRASTSKLIANDAMELSLLISDNMEQEDSTYKALTIYAKADLLVYQNHYEDALITLDSVRIVGGLSHPIYDEVLYKKAQIKCLQGKFRDAEELLKNLVTMYPYDILADDALYLLAKLNEEQFKNNLQAMEYYEKIFTDYPSSLYATEARKKFRQLRGDK